MEQEKLIEAIESIRRDKKDPWRYMLFTFLNGMAQGLGVALGMTLVLGLVIYFLSLFIARMVDFPVVGQYFEQIGKLIDAYSKAAPTVK
jgi:hypothetical protein